MRELGKRIQVTVSSLLAVLLVGMYPAATFAEVVPVGTNPSISSPAPAPSPPAPSYIYDPATGRWNTNIWKYDAASGQYKPVLVTGTGPISPTGPTTTPGPVSPTGPTSTPASSTSTPTSTVPTTTDTSKGSGGVLGATSLVGAQGQAPTGTTGSTNNTAVLTGNTAVTTNNGINNTLGSTSLTGNTAVSGNTAAGGATSGNASASQTVINTVNSSVASGAAGVANFVSNISGNVNGDILLYPMILAAMLAQSALTPTTSTTNLSANATLNANTNNQINNNLNLGATSGTAAVAGNTSAGNATSGSANAVADVMNIINSSIAANQSFVGTINIYGNLNGDILLAPNFLPQLLGSNSSTTVNQALNTNVTNTNSIANNVNLSANSGAAAVAGNTSAGNATSGSAKTNVVILNLTGHDIIASNSLLVFVNVLGKWVGLIVNAPNGSTAAALGNGVNQNTTANASATVSAQTNNQITNNINVAAQSGNASVTKNTKAGNATTGNATASANILNMSQSSLDLSGWFGVLFINVFGSWLGSFGVDTSAGNPQQQASGGNGASATGASQQPQAVRFIAKPANVGSSSWHPNGLVAATGSDITGSQPPVSQSVAPPATVLGANTSSQDSKNTNSSSNVPLVAAMAVGSVVLLAAGLWLSGYQRAGRLV